MSAEMDPRFGHLKRVLYVGAFRFPDGDAGAQRVLGIARAIRGLGVAVEFCGWRKKDGPDDLGASATKSFDGFAYTNVPEFRWGNDGPVARIRHHLKEGSLTLGWLQQNATAGDAVILYNFYGPYAAKIIAFCQARQIPVMVDSVEWYAPHQCAGGPFGLVRWEVEWSLRRAFRKANGVIAISSLLDRHFATTTPTVRIPPLVDVTDPKWTVTAKPRHQPGIIDLCYCGFPGKKDNLTNLFVALAQLGSDASRFAVTLIGPERTQIDRLLTALKIPAPPNLRCLGRLAHGEALQALGAADYSVLIRPDARYAHAGFSTKFVESLAVGAPPFCNCTSDIADYTKDGKDSIHLKSDSVAAIADALRRIESISSAELAALRGTAKETAARKFDWRNYVGVMGNFLHRMTGEGA